jgi:hypothetical protein
MLTGLLEGATRNVIKLQGPGSVLAVLCSEEKRAGHTSECACRAAYSVNPVLVPLWNWQLLVSLQGTYSNSHSTATTV